MEDMPLLLYAVELDIVDDDKNYLTMIAFSLLYNLHNIWYIQYIDNV